MMRRLVNVARMLIAIGALLLTVVLNCQQKSFSGQLAECGRASATTLMAPQKHHHHEATLTDATGLYRVCSSRPQRLFPTQGSKTERTASPGGLVRHHIVKRLQFPYDGRRRQETAPFCLSASCLYYVIALRHIIR